MPAGTVAFFECHQNPVGPFLEQVSCTCLPLCLGTSGREEKNQHSPAPAWPGKMSLVLHQPCDPDLASWASLDLDFGRREAGGKADLVLVAYDPDQEPLDLDLVLSDLDLWDLVLGRNGCLEKWVERWGLSLSQPQDWVKRTSGSEPLQGGAHESETGSLHLSAAVAAAAAAAVGVVAEAVAEKQTVAASLSAAEPLVVTVAAAAAAAVVAG